MQYDLQEMADLLGNGEKKLYPRPTFSSQLQFKTFVKELSQASGLNAGVISTVLQEVSKRMDMYMQIGHSIKIEGLGTFTPSLTQLKDGEKRMSTVTYDQRGVHFNTVNFLPDAEWLKRLRKQTQPEYSGNTKKVRENSTTRDERLALAKAFLQQHHVMRVSEYAALTEQCHTKASNELREFKNDESTGIISIGSHSSLIYKLKEQQ